MPHNVPSREPPALGQHLCFGLHQVIAINLKMGIGVINELILGVYGFTCGLSISCL